MEENTYPYSPSLLVDAFAEHYLGLAARNKANSGIDVTRRPVLLELLGRLEVLVFIPERFSHLFRCSGNS